MDEGLRAFVDEATDGSRLRVEDDLGHGFVRLRVSEAERRQARHDIRSSEDVVIELLRNSRDAGARSIFVALSRSGDERTIAIVDDGSGIPPELHELVFEARVTSKLDSERTDRWGVHGRGMALYSIRERAKDARVVSSGVGKGAAIAVTTDVRTVTERTDQSSMPDLSFDEAGNLTVRGPRNINRTLVEFVLAEQDSCVVYAGSPVEIAATLYQFGLAVTTPALRAFFPDVEELPLTKRLCTASDPAEFRAIAAGLGLVMSERSARRAMDGTVAALRPLVETLSFTYPETAAPESGKRQRTADPWADARSLRLSSDDMTLLKARLQDAWAETARAYYLDAQVEPRVTVRKDGVHVTFPVKMLP